MQRIGDGISAGLACRRTITWCSAVLLRTLQLSISEVIMGRRPRKFDPTASAAALFGAKVRKHREAQGWSQDQLGEKVFCTGDLISKIELAVRSPSQQMAAAFDRLFGTGEYFQELWHLVNKETLPDWFRPYPDLEAEATTMHTFGLVLIPGLLQTEDYASEIFRTGQTPEKLDQLLATRMKRQEILTRDTPPRLWVVLDEKALRTGVGGPEIMKGQITYLIELAQRPNVTLQIVPDGRGAYLGLTGPITILSFEEGPDAVYFENHAGGQLVEEAAAVENCGERFQLIRASALSQEESLNLLKTSLESL
ncbi:MAG TPA: helix-turn-helix transcriptional regulator [Streptosporangiaceae bacterium]|nr:helix-turn-helix transcriptional regulator [Streptosporangiaceae bacterium]